MRRKLDLGASLVGAPELLLLDEPTTGLDPRSRNDLWDAMRNLVSAGTDVLLTTQYLDEADHLAARIAIIDHGKVIAEGTPDELRSKAGDDVIELHVVNDGSLVLAVLLCVFAAFAFTWMFVLLGILSGNPQAAQGMGLLVFPFTFVSSASCPSTRCRAGCRRSPGTNR